METKDILTLVISASALLLSEGVALYNMRRKRNEEKVALRNLLTDAFKAMTSTDLELLLQAVYNRF